jgi:hypothetical protein
MCIIETGFDDEKMQQLLQSDRGLAVLLEPILLEPILLEPILLEPILLEPSLLEPILNQIL